GGAVRRQPAGHHRPALADVATGRADPGPGNRSPGPGPVPGRERSPGAPTEGAAGMSTVEFSDEDLATIRRAAEAAAVAGIPEAQAILYERFRDRGPVVGLAAARETDRLLDARRAATRGRR